MQLLQSWKDSLKFFHPRNFKLFALVSLNAARATYWSWLELFGPIFILSFLFDAFFYFLIFPGFYPFGFICSLFKFILLFGILLCVRPSKKRKTYKYIISYYVHFFYGFILFLATYLTVFFIVADKSDALVGDTSGYDCCLWVSSPLLAILISSLFLFYFDSRGGLDDLFASFFRALKLVVYGLPFYCVISLITGFLFFVVQHVFIFLSHYSFLVPLEAHIIVFLTVIPVSFAATFYTKKIHDQPKLYFK